MSTTLTHPLDDQSRISQFFRDAHTGSRTLWLSAWIMLAFFVACSLLSQIDDRLLIGVSVWEKPAKFFLSVAVHFLTVAWALSLVTGTIRQSRSIRWSIAALVVASCLELIIISGRALRGEASHFNTVTAFDGALYAMMGIGAVTMTLTSGIIGFRIWQNRQNGLWAKASGLGIMLGALLTTVVAGYMSSQEGGHWVGGELSDANGLAFFHWSTTGGDLRVAHFIGLHATQIVPFAALGGRHSLIYATALVTIAATAVAFVQALYGVPLFKL
jgi:hypothetical protein